MPAPIKHGHHTRKSGRSKEYIAWDHMKQRCINPKDRQFPNYGGRGITVCERWSNSFSDFLEDMGPAPGSEYSIERIDNNKGYSPENCKWALKKEQCNNTRKNVKLTFGGKTLTVAQWADTLLIPRSSLYGRLERGWSPEKALTEKFKTRKCKVDKVVPQ
jgi:hypothetical protein